IVMNSRDITEFIEQDQELMESLRRYDIVAKATSDLITDYDIEKDEIKVSDVAFEMLGYHSEQGIYPGKWWNSNLHPDDYENVEFLARQMRDEGTKNLTIEYRFKCADGSYKYILDRSYLIVDENNKPKRIIGSMQDITERKEHLIAIETHNKRLREIAWTQSHLVRAPLAKVMGLVDLLLNYKNDLENVEEILENILNSANELDNIIRKIAVQTEKEL
ncbi:MAG: PAS domain-containing protein, partial [Christiangramia sp.]